MNYLAHLFLAGQEPGLIVGNILEDYITGNINNEFNIKIDSRLRVGIIQHRHIDTITDTHITVKKCKALFYSEFGKYAPIITDVLFDHYLLKNWNLYTSENFEDFRPRIYKAFDYGISFQPNKMRALVASMIEHDWLKHYDENWGLERAFLNLNKKINKPDIDLRKSLVTFEKEYDLLDENFKVFFTDLKSFCDNFIIENQIDVAENN